MTGSAKSVTSRVMVRHAYGISDPDDMKNGGEERG